jgi:hypothetical protein
VADWATISALATAGGTLVLAAATFASVRSANRASRTAERALLAGLRPVLVPSRFQDPPEKIGFMDEHWVKVEGGRAVAEVSDGVVYLAIALRNVGSGIAVLDRWDFFPQRALNDVPHRDPAQYRRLTRDLYVPPGDLGFWQGAFRDVEDPIFNEAAAAIKARQPVTVDLFYGDHEGGQHTISRFGLIPRADGAWITAVSRHWNIERDDPR